jgi:hypothetical protein
MYGVRCKQEIVSALFLQVRAGGEKKKHRPPLVGRRFRHVQSVVVPAVLVRAIQVGNAVVVPSDEEVFCDLEDGRRTVCVRHLM